MAESIATGEQTLSGSTGWAIDLENLHTATGIVAAQARLIQLQNQSIKANMDRISSVWQAPSGESFVPLKAAFQSAATTLEELLNDAVIRMRKAHANYVDAEDKNTQMLKHGG
jgi:uncharacterized protein YukE